MATQLSSVGETMTQHFIQNGWPKTVLFTGPQSPHKEKWLLDYILQELYKTKEQEIDSIATNNLRKILTDNGNPDFYYFKAKTIKIGKSNALEHNTIRHLQQTFAIYSPYKHDKRFVYFSDISYIGDEAETALLKLLEEPPPQTHFILSAEDHTVVKDTILSRCIQMPYVQTWDPSLVSPEPWKRFWHLSGYEHKPIYQQVCDKKWDQRLIDNMDRLVFHQKDFLVFNQLGIKSLKIAFPKETIEIQNEILILTFMPLYYSIRDNLVEGMLPSIGPIHIPNRSKENRLTIATIIQYFFMELRTKHHNTIYGNQNIIFYKFLSYLMKYWP